METTLREPRPEKVAVVDEVRERLGSASAAILTEYRGLRVSDLATLRKALGAAGGEYKVFKNTLVRRAAHEQGLTDLDDLLEGPTAIAFVRDDPGAVAKVLRDFARTNPALVVKGGLLGQNVLDARAATALADLPSREQLLAGFAGLLAAPMQRMASLLAAVPQKLAYGLQALIDQRKETSPSADEPVASDEAPATSDEAPAASDEAPAASDDAPVASDEAPAASDETPAASDEAPAASDETPAETDAKGESAAEASEGGEASAE